MVLADDSATPTPGSDLVAGLERIHLLATAGRTRMALDELRSFRASLDACWNDTADEMARVASARLREREQLRGRLDAYSAEADVFGLDEDPAVTEAHDRAEAALFTAPTDLDAASELVFRYQQLVSDTSPHGRVPR